MPDLNFQVESVEVVPYAATPLLAFRLRVENAVAGEMIHTASLHCQIQISATRRSYTPEEQSRLLDLYGEPERWSQTLRTLLWTHADVVVPQFMGATSMNLKVPCTFDFNVASTKYFHGLSGGDLPLEFLFSGMVFYGDHNGALQVSPISWEKEAKFRLPQKVWRELIDAYYPNTAWLCLRRDVFDRLNQYKMRRGIPTWEQALEAVLDSTDAAVKP